VVRRERRFEADGATPSAARGTRAPPIACGIVTAVGRRASHVSELRIRDWRLGWHRLFSGSVHMKKLSKVLLVVALVALIGGFVEAARPGGWGVGIPLGVVFLGLFAITRVLGGETERFDAEEHTRVAEAEKALTSGGAPHH
jgi:hypothetical protein